MKCQELLWINSLFLHYLQKIVCMFDEEKKYADAVSVREDPIFKRCAFKRNMAETIH